MVNKLLFINEFCELNQNMPRYETKIYTVDVTTPANGTYTGTMGITSEDWYSSAKMIIPLFARKTGSGEICVVEYEFGTIRLQSDISFSGVTVGIGVIF